MLSEKRSAEYKCKNATYTKMSWKLKMDCECKSKMIIGKKNMVIKATVHWNLPLFRYILISNLFNLQIHFDCIWFIV